MGERGSDEVMMDVEDMLNSQKKDEEENEKTRRKITVELTGKRIRTFKERYERV